MNPDPGIGTVILTREARRRAGQLVQQLRTDELLDLIVHMWTRPAMTADLPLTLILDGVVIRGRLTTPEESAEHLDALLLDFLSNANLNLTGDDDEVSQAEVEEARGELVQALGNRFLDRVRRNRNEEAATRQKLDDLWGENKPDFAAVPDELLDDVIRYFAPPVVIPLRDAEVMIPGEGWNLFGHIRVNLRSVGAWWVSNDEVDSDHQRGA